MCRGRPCVCPDNLIRQVRAGRNILSYFIGGKWNKNQLDKILVNGYFGGGF